MVATPLHVASLCFVAQEVIESEMRIDLENKPTCHRGWQESHMAIVDNRNGLVTVLIGNGSGQAYSLLTVDEARIVAAAINREASIIERQTKST